MAAVCGHRGCEWEEPWGAPRALGQLRTQVRVAPTHPTGGLESPPEASAVSPHLRVGALQGAPRRRQAWGVEKRGNERAKAWR